MVAHRQGKSAEETATSAQAQLLAKLDRELVKRFRKRLIDDEVAYREWLEQRIREYLKGSAK